MYDIQLAVMSMDTILKLEGGVGQAFLSDPDG